MRMKLFLNGKPKITKNTNRLFDAIAHSEHSKSHRIFNDVLATVILLSSLAIILESVETLKLTYHSLFIVADIIFTAIFLFEYVMRIIYSKKSLRYVFSTFGIIDLLSFLPSLLLFISPLFASFHSLRVLRIIRIIRLLRLFRILKLIAYSKRRHLKKSHVLRGLVNSDMQIFFFTLFALITISGTLMWLVEGGVPNTQFISIPLGMWWAVVTVTTIGYGDIVPITTLGRIIASFTMISGLLMFALLVTVMGRVAQSALFGSTLDEENKLK